MEATFEAREGLMLPQGNLFGSQDPSMVQQCTDIPSAAMQRRQWGLSLAAELGIDYVEAYGPYREMRPLLQSNIFEPQGSVPQQCETGRGQFPSEVSAKLAAPKEEQAEAGSGHYSASEPFVTEITVPCVQHTSQGIQYAISTWRPNVHFSALSQLYLRTSTVILSR